MSSHHRTDSESSFEFVKTEGEAEVLLDDKTEEKKTDEFSLKDEVYSNDSDSSESSDSNVSESEEEGEETKNQRKESETVKVIENMVGDSMGLTVEIPEIVETPVLESSQKIMIETPLTVETAVEVKDAVETLKIVLNSDPLGATGTPIHREEAANQEAIVGALSTELGLLRSEIQKIKEVQNKQCQKMIEIQERLDVQKEAERQKELQRYSPITTAICGEWRLLNLNGQNENMKADGFSFPNRFKSLVAHTIYDFTGHRLSSHQRLFCKTFGHSSLKFGPEGARGAYPKTFLRGNMLVTIWKDERGVTLEKKERYVMDGQLYISHVNRFGERNTMVYEKVKSKVDYLASIGNVSRLYLKFW